MPSTGVSPYGRKLKTQQEWGTESTEKQSEKLAMSTKQMVIFSPSDI